MRNFEKSKSVGTIFEKNAKIFLAGIKEQRDKSGGRIVLGDNTGGEVVLMRLILDIGLYWSLDLNCTALCNKHVPDETHRPK